MTTPQVRCQWRDFASVGSGWVEFANPERRTRSESGSTAPLLSPRLAERGAADQRFARVGPAVRMGVVAIVGRQPRLNAFLECRGTGEVATLEKAPTPVCIEIVHDPIEAFHERELRGDVLQMPDPIDAGARWTQVPNDLAGGNAEGRQQGAGAVADVLELTLFEGAGPGQSRGILPLEDLHPGLLVARQDQTALFVKAWGIEV